MRNERKSSPGCLILAVSIVVVVAVVFASFFFLSTSLLVFQAHVFERTKKCSAFVHRASHQADRGPILCEFHSQLHEKRLRLRMCICVCKLVYVASHTRTHIHSHQHISSRPHYIFLGWSTTGPLFLGGIYRKAHGLFDTRILMRNFRYTVDAVLLLC